MYSQTCLLAVLEALELHRSARFALVFLFCIVVHWQRTRLGLTLCSRVKCLVSRFVHLHGRRKQQLSLCRCFRWEQQFWFYLLLSNPGFAATNLVWRCTWSSSRFVTLTFLGTCSLMPLRREKIVKGSQKVSLPQRSENHHSQQSV